MITVDVKGAGCTVKRTGPPCGYAIALDEALSSLKRQGIDLGPFPPNASRCEAIYRFRVLVNGGDNEGSSIQMSLASVFLA